MLILRIILAFSVLFFVGIGIAYAVTRDKKYLRLAKRVFLAVVVLFVAFGLFYVFSRVLRF